MRTANSRALGPIIGLLMMPSAFGSSGETSPTLPPRPTPLIVATMSEMPPLDVHESSLLDSVEVVVADLEQLSESHVIACAEETDRIVWVFSAVSLPLLFAAGRRLEDRPIH